MNEIKLIVSDLDGTLLNDNKEVDTNIKKVIKKLKEKNILFTIATGRTNSMTNKVIKELNIDIPYICDNGGSIFKNNKRLKDYGISFDEILNIVEIFEKYKVYYVVYGFKSAYAKRMTDRIKYFYEKATDLKKVNKLNEMEKDIVVKITVDSNGVKDFEKAKKEIDEKCKSISFKISEDTLYTVTDIKSTKGNALEYISDYLNINLENVMAFGDNYNDYTMLKKAHIGVSMEDSKEELKKVSKFIALSNNKNGVSRFLTEFFDLKV